MSENEIKAMEYSAKCERRRARKAKRRSARISGLVRFSLPFSIGCLLTACFVAALV
nr:MAG TPA: hypothetical protein [Caudoviricetes sp.]